MSAVAPIIARVIGLAGRERKLSTGVKAKGKIYHSEAELKADTMRMTKLELERAQRKFVAEMRKQGASEVRHGAEAAALLAAALDRQESGGGRG